MEVRICYSFLNPFQNKLTSFFPLFYPDLVKSFPQLPNEAQDQAGILIRDLIINFSDICSGDFWRVWGVVVESGGGGGDGRNGSIDLAAAARPSVSNANGIASGYGSGKKEPSATATAGTGTGASSVGELSALAERLYDLIWDMVGVCCILSLFQQGFFMIMCLGHPTFAQFLCTAGCVVMSHSCSV